MSERDAMLAGPIYHVSQLTWREELSHRRPYQMPDGSVRWVYLSACQCGDARRGPAGGVCGHCGQAIPGKHGAT